MLEQAPFDYKRFQEMVEKGLNRGFPEFPRTPSNLVFIYPPSLSFLYFPIHFRHLVAYVLPSQNMS